MDNAIRGINIRLDEFRIGHFRLLVILGVPDLQFLPVNRPDCRETLNMIPREK